MTSRDRRQPPPSRKAQTLDLAIVAAAAFAMALATQGWPETAPPCDSAVCDHG